MRVTVLLKANADTEAGVLPAAGTLNAMGRYNAELQAQEQARRDTIESQQQ